MDMKRDLLGYGETPPHPHWPGDARIALQFVLNFEEGGENCILYGDPGAETFLSEIIGAAPVPSARHMSMESLYEYGSRAGVWRLLKLFDEMGIPLTVFAVAQALKHSPHMADAFLSRGHEIASHGLKWINYQDIDKDTERAHIEESIDIFKKLTGGAPQGWYTGRTSPNTRDLVSEYGFVYDADDYSDDLPFWSSQTKTPHLIVPYTLDTNDMRFNAAQGFNAGDQFYTYLKDAFDTLYAEGEHAPKMLSIGLHCRISGRPGRTAALARFLKYVKSHDRVWCARRIDIANHWRQEFPHD
jgi:putative urate catabolism protein